jgi:hypothetical protein
LLLRASPLTRFVVRTLIMPALACIPAAAASGDRAVLQADQAFTRALAKPDQAAAGKLLDEDFTWTDSAGEIHSRTSVLAHLPTPPLGGETGAQVTERTYGLVGTIQVSTGKEHILRIWVKRPAGWRVLIYHEVKQAAEAARPGPATNECINPCKTVPYTPKNNDEAAVIKSWSQLETAVVNHDPQVWSSHFLDEFVLISSNGPSVATKADRLATLSKPGIGPAPPGLVEGRMFDFPSDKPETIVMVSTAQGYSGKPVHISRVWVKRDGSWRMALSYQTTIQSAPDVVPETKPN